jgi:hypothetical protein
MTRYVGMLPALLASGGKAYVRAPVSSIVLNKEGTKALGVVVRWVFIERCTVCLDCSYYLLMTVRIIITMCMF